MKTTKKDFELFKSYCEKWADILGIKGWTIYYHHRAVEGTYAQTAWNFEGTAATISFNTEWDNLRAKTDIEIESLAIHEILHVLFAPFCHAAERRFVSQDMLYGAEHHIIRTLENVFRKQAAQESRNVIKRG